MKLKNLLMLLAISISSVTLLTACSGNKATVPSQQQKAEEQSSSKKPVQLDFYNGNPVQSEGLITIPVIVKNSGTNKTVISSQNFTLKIAGRKFKPFQVNGEPSDFHQEVDSSTGWQNVISFYLGTTLTKTQLKKATLVYKDDKDTEVSSQFISNSDAQSVISTSASANYLAIGDYFDKAIDYIKTAKDDIKQGTDVSSLKDQFQDDKYDRFRMWVVSSSKFSNTAIVKAINHTNTDLKIPLGDIEVEDNDKNDVQVAPSLRDYSIMLPHGKATTVAIPLETKLSANEAPFSVLVRPSNGSSFESTKGSFYPIEFAFNNSSDLPNAFGVTPDLYSKDSIKWEKPEIVKNTLKVSVKLYDYYYLDSKASDYTLVGLNKNGSVGDKETPQKVTPLKVTGTGEKITLEFDDLSVIRTYKQIELRYKKAKLVKIR